MFFEYLKERGETVANYDFGKWIIYFRRNATFRTICYDCYDQIELNYKMQIKRKRAEELQLKRQKEEEAEINELTEHERLKWL